MSLQNLLKKLFEKFRNTETLQTKSKEKSSGFFQNEMLEISKHFFYQNKQEILIIIFSLILLVFCTWVIVGYSFHAKERKKVNDAGASVSASSEKETSVDKPKGEVAEPKRSWDSTLENKNWDKELLFLLSGVPEFPEASKEEFSNDYVELFPLNNYNRTDINPIMDEYDKMIENSIEDSCSFNFERRRK